MEKDTVKKIIELAKMAPSGVNCQPWKIYVVMGDARDSLVAEALSKVDAGKMDKEEYTFIPQRDRTGIKLDKGQQGLACIRL